MKPYQFDRMTPPDWAEVEALHLPELRQLAAANGITGVARLAKAAILAALRRHADVIQRASGKISATSSYSPRPNPAPAAPLTMTTASPPASSPIRLPAAQPAPDIGDRGLPIPPDYGLTRVTAMPQDPRHLFVYWEVAPAALGVAAAAAGPGWASILLIRGPDGEETRHVELSAGNYYLNALPGSTYQVRLALRSADGRLIQLAASALVQMPPAGPSWRTDEAWLQVDELWTQLQVASADPGFGVSSITRHRVERRLSVRAVASGESETLASGSAPELAAQDLGSGSSHRAGGSSEQRPRAEGAVGLSSYSGGSSGLVGSSGGVGSSHLGSSRLSSRAVGSGHQLSDSEALYSVESLYGVDLTGLPKAAEGIASPRPAPAALPNPGAGLVIAPADSAPAFPAPRTADVAVPHIGSIEPQSLGAPKPRAQRKPPPRR